MDREEFVQDSYFANDNSILETQVSYFISLEDTLTKQDHERREIVFSQAGIAIALSGAGFISTARKVYEGEEDFPK